MTTQWMSKEDMESYTYMLHGYQGPCNNAYNIVLSLNQLNSLVPYLPSHDINKPKAHYI